MAAPIELIADSTPTDSVPADSIATDSRRADSISSNAHTVNSLPANSLPAHSKRPYYVTCKFQLSSGEKFGIHGTAQTTNGRATIVSTNEARYIILSFPGGEEFPDLSDGPGEPFSVHCEIHALGAENIVIDGVVSPTTDRSVIVVESVEGDKWIIGMIGVLC